MTVDKNKVVTLECNLRENDGQGEIMDTYTANEPMIILYGAENVFEAFEEKISGL